MGWVTVFGREYHLSYITSHPGQLSLLPPAGRGIRTDQSTQRLGSKAEWLIPFADKRAGGSDPSLTRAMPEHSRHEYIALIIRRYIDYCLLYILTSTS